MADGGMSHELLAATVALPEEQLLDATRQAVGSGLLISHGDGYAFPHALIRQVLYADLLPGDRHRLHRRLAGALAARADADPGLLAQHWHLAACPDQAAAAAIVAARRAVSARAYPEADRTTPWPSSWRSGCPEAGPGLLEEAAQAASWAGDPGSRRRMGGAGAWPSPARAPRTDRARLLERLGRYRWEAGDLRAAAEATEQAVAMLPDGPPSALRARVLAALATWSMLLGEFDRGPADSRSGRSLKRSRPARSRSRPMAWRRWASSRHSAANCDAGMAALRRHSTSPAEAGNVEDVVRAATNHMYLLYTAGRFTEALEVARGRAARPPGPWTRRPR